MKINFNDEKTIERIEKALGFKLYPWQVRYLQSENMKINPGYRGCGNSTIYAVKQLLTLDGKLNLTWTSKDIEFLIDRGGKSRVMQGMMKPMIENIDYKLKSVGFETCLYTGESIGKLTLQVEMDGLEEAMRSVEKYCSLIDEATSKLEQAEQISKRLKDTEFNITLND